MQVGKQDLILAQHCALIQLRLLDLDDHVRRRKDLFRRAGDRSTCVFVIGIGHADAQTSISFDNDLVAIVYQLANTRRRHANTKLERLYLFWYSDFHGSSPEFLLSADMIRR